MMNFCIKNDEFCLGGAGSQPPSKIVYSYKSSLDRNAAPTAGTYLDAVCFV